MFRQLTLLLLALLAVACGNPEYSDAVSQSGNSTAWEADQDDFADAETVVSEDSGEGSDRQTLAQQQQRLIIKTGSMSVQVDDIDVAVGQATSYATGLGGYVQEQNISGSGRFRSATLVLAVPSSQFENAMAAFRAYGEVNSENASGQDVTEEFVDLNSRLTNLEATQTRLRELYEAATDVEETLEVDRELRRIEEEINIVQGRINYLAERAAFSTITLDFSFVADPVVAEPEAWNLSYTVNQALADLRDTGQRWADGLVYFAIAVLPFLLVFVLVVAVITAIVRRIYRRATRA